MVAIHRRGKMASDLYILLLACASRKFFRSHHIWLFKYMNIITQKIILL